MTHLNESLNSRQKRKKKSPEYNANPADLSLTFICYESMQNFIFGRELPQMQID